MHQLAEKGGAPASEAAAPAEEAKAEPAAEEAPAETATVAEEA